MTLSSVVFIFIVLLCCSSQIQNVASAADYREALTKSLLYFEGQRSGKLPPNQRLKWRGDSGLQDGHDAGLFDFANNHQGMYSDSITPAKQIYSSSGYKDELLWAAAWLQRATKMQKYLDYLGGAGDTGGVRTVFSWDDKYVGAHVLAAKLVLDGEVGASGIWAQYKSQAEEYICSCAQKSNQNTDKTAGGLLWFLPWNNNQYVATATFVMSVYSNYLSSKGASLQCSAGNVTPDDLTSLVRSQVDYILGSNPKGISYMVGYGPNFPQQIHHRGASIVSININHNPVSCQGGFQEWFYKNAPNPNVLEGAVVSPDRNDNYEDSRNNYQLAEPATVTLAPLVGVLAHLA